jgi:hypothetical protein
MAAVSRGQSLREARLRGVNLTGANLTGANLSGADLSGAILSFAQLCWADLGGADLTDAKLGGANLTGADLTDANLTDADLSGADLTDAKLTGAGLRGAKLTGADLTDANLTGADLSGATLGGANLSGAVGLLDPIEWLRPLRDDAGDIICYRAEEGEFAKPEGWSTAPGSILREVVNPLPTSACACGVNVGTLEWCLSNYPDQRICRCRIPREAEASIVVPYNTDGRFRAGMVEVIGPVEDDHAS